jgi:hypothetical protein
MLDIPIGFEGPQPDVPIVVMIQCWMDMVSTNAHTLRSVCPVLCPLAPSQAGGRGQCPLGYG